jgi:capsular polysaccharide biosynthesis protein
MINLLPSDKKAEIRAARTNLILVRYIIILILAISFIAVAMYVTYSVLAMTKTSNEAVVASNDLSSEVYSSTRQQVSALNDSLRESKVVIDQEVRYSKVFVNLAQLMPAGTLFDKISLNGNSFLGTASNLRVYAKSTTETDSLRQNFERSSMISGVTVTIVTATDSGVDGYPVSADVTMTLNKAGIQ